MRCGKMDDPVRENVFFTDDAAVIAKMLANEWSLGPENTPNIMYIPETYIVNSRVGSIYVYVAGTPKPRISTTDYRTLDKSVRVNIKLDTRRRDTHFLWGEEIVRIILANRRKGRRNQVGASYLELGSVRPLPNESGWYTTIIEVTLVYHNMAIRSAGFGDKINRQIEDNNHQ